MTELIAAIENPHVDIIGHPTGRMLGLRDGYTFDVEAVLQAAAATGTALEINRGWWTTRRHGGRGTGRTDIDQQRRQPGLHALVLPGCQDVINTLSGELLPGWRSRNRGAGQVEASQG